MKSKNITYIAILVLVILGIIFFAFPSSNITNINSNAVKKLIENEDVFVVQVHEPYMGEISGTNLVVSDWKNLDKYSSQLPKDVNTPIIIYCRSGRMSSIASKQLEDMGYTNIYHFENGMNQWQSDGNKLIQREVKEFNVEVGNEYFNPKEIIVNEGDYVKITFKVVDGYHGVFIPELGISKPLPEGETILVEFVADKKGEFSFFCNVPCGSGHREMSGKIIIN